MVCSEITFSKSSYHIEANQLISLQINWPVSMQCDFYWKMFQNDFRILLVLYDPNIRNQEY